MIDKIRSVLLVLAAELISLIISFFLTPLVASVSERWIWISFETLMLVAVHFVALFFLARKSPVLWAIGIPVNFLFVFMMCNINCVHAADALSLYGISSRYTELQNFGTDIFPYYVDCLLFAMVIFFAREVFAVSVYYLTCNSSDKEEGNTDKQ